MIDFIVMVGCFFAGAYRLPWWVPLVPYCWAVVGGLIYCRNMSRHLALSDGGVPLGLWAGAFLVPGATFYGAYGVGSLYGSYG